MRTMMLFESIVRRSHSLSFSFLSSKSQRIIKSSSIVDCSQLFVQQQHLHHNEANNNNHDNLSVAIVGSGPSGFYTAKYLHLAIQRAITAIHNENSDGGNNNNNANNILHSLKQLNIDMIDRLPTPFGLVRSGVAPDHPEVKNVENDFVALMQKLNENKKDRVKEEDKNILSKNNNHEQCNDNLNTRFQTSMEFRGNVHVGKDISLDELRDLYDVVILSYGCESDKKLGIENNSLQGIYSAREFVAWYNGHPDYVHMTDVFYKMLADGHPENANVVVIGQGNVALDCARILAKGRVKLMDTDIASHALPILKDGVKNITVIGRRGHIQGSFTIKELRELTKLGEEGCDTLFQVNDNELNAGTTEASLEELKQSRPKSRIDKLLRESIIEPSSISKSKKVTLRFMLNPVKFIADHDDPAKLGSILCEKCQLQGEAFQQVAVGTGEMEEIPANMVLVSIGYKGVPLLGMDSVMFDDKKGVVRNIHGRVENHENNGTKDVAGLYVSGWLKRGPSGIIGTNISDAKDTVSSIMEDLLSDKMYLSCGNKKGRIGLDSLLNERKVQEVNWSGYEKIDLEEKHPSRLRSKKQPREKITSIQAMLQIVK